MPKENPKTGTMEKPKLKMNLSKLDYFLEIVSWTGIIIIWLLLILTYESLPEIIPTHYNLQGEVDNLGEKSKLFSLPIVASIIFIGISIFSKFPNLTNYPVEINAGNAERQYKISTRLLRILKVCIVLIFSLILISTIAYANKSSQDLGKWFLPSVLVLIFIPILFYLKKAIKNK